MEEVQRVSKIAKSIIRQKTVKVFVQFDSDGISSAGILLKTLLREKVNFEIHVFKQLTENLIESIRATPDDFLIFADFGSGQMSLMKKILDTTNVLILDHHEPAKFDHINLLHVNPLLFGEDEMSASIVCYLFAKFMSVKNVDLVDLAIVGAVGDEVDGGREFKGLPKKILEEAESLGKISSSRGLRLYGRFSRPIHKALAYTFDPFIPGISGDEARAVQFLTDIGINPKQNGDWLKLKDLSDEEQQKLASAIILERLKSEQQAEDIFGESYTLLGRPEELQDVREFSTMVNACGRTGNPHVAIRLMLADYSALDESYKIMEIYRGMISGALSWLRENAGKIVKKDFANFIVARERIPETIIGTITSISINSNFVEYGKPLFGLAYTADGLLKISARAPREFAFNLRDVLQKVSEHVGGQMGGHFLAAGGYIEKGKEEEFIRTTDMVIGELIAGKKG